MSSKGKPSAPEEVQAARQFEDLTGTVCEPLDGTGGPGEPDFAVFRREHGCLWPVTRRRNVGTLEVTRAAHEPTRRLQGRIRTASQANGFELTSTSYMWHVQVEPTADSRTLPGDIENVVGHLEALGLTQASRWSPEPQSAPFSGTGITSVMRGEPTTPGRASVLVVGLGGPTSTDVIAEVAEAEVAKNRKKLAPEPRLTRHLWVWLEFDVPEGADAMAYAIASERPSRMPRAPRLDPRCTVWLAVPQARWALQWSAPDGWRLLRPPNAPTGDDPVHDLDEPW